MNHPGGVVQDGSVQDTPQSGLSSGLSTPTGGQGQVQSGDGERFRSPDPSLMGKVSTGMGIANGISRRDVYGFDNTRGSKLPTGKGDTYGGLPANSPLMNYGA